MARLNSQAGLGLTEVLVSIAVLALAMTTALVLYDDARRSFRLNENVINQQQVVRIAFDVVSRDLRQAGLNTNPDGADDRPDEQIEAAYPAAIVVRADFDAGTPEARVPEAELEAAGSFEAVSTGNDEIVGYALGSPAANDPFEFWADVEGRTRDGAVERVQVPRIALEHDAPPYTLYRITLDDDAGVVKTPLADNVRSMSFAYYDQAGNAVPAVGGGESDDDVEARKSIRRIVIEIVGLTQDSDRDWNDPADTHPYSRGRRKFRLGGELTPRNLGMKGIMDPSADLTLPPPPFPPQPVPGHCQGLWVGWPEPPREAWGYVVSWADTAGASGEQTAAGLGVYLDGLTHGLAHDVRLQTVDPFGNVSDPTPAVRAITSNVTVPAVPQNVQATNDLDGRVDIGWDALTANDGPIPGDPASPLLRDLRRYHIQRRPASGGDWLSRFRPDGTTGYSETEVMTCVDYEFRVRGQDQCDAYGGWSDIVHGMAQSPVAPRAPDNVEAFLISGGSAARVRWQAVDRNVNGDPLLVDYEVYRVYWSGADPPADIGLYTRIADVAGTRVPLEYDDVAFAVPPSQRAFYRIVAVDGCGNASAPSAAAEPENCLFTGDVQFVTPEWGAATSGATPVVVEVVGGAESYTEARLEFTNLDTSITDPLIVCPGACTETTGPGTIRWEASWNNLLARPHRIEAHVSTSDGCTVTRTLYVEGTP